MKKTTPLTQPSSGTSSSLWVASTCDEGPAKWGQEILGFSPSWLKVWKVLLEGSPVGSTGKESACNAGDLGSAPGLERPPGEGKGCPPQYSGLENPMGCVVNGVAKSRTRLSNFYFHFFNPFRWGAVEGTTMFWLGNKKWWGNMLKC